MWLNEMEEDLKSVAKISRRLTTIKNISYHYQEYLALGEGVHAVFPFKNYFNIEYRCWPKNVDEDSFKRPRHKLKRNEHEG